MAIIETSAMTIGQRLGASVSRVGYAVVDGLPGIVAGVVLLLLSWWVSGLVRRGVRRVMARTSTEGHVDVLVARTAGATTFVVGAIIALGVTGVQVTALVASLGLVGVTIGFALKDVLANSMAGVLLLLQRPFTIGDSITVSGFEGVVIDIRVRDTMLRTGDGRIVYIPNASVFDSPIVNISANPVRRFEIALTVPGGIDLRAAEQTVAGAIAATPGVAKDPEAEAQTSAAGARWARIVGHGWVDCATCALGVTQGASLIAARDALAATGMLDGGGERIADEPVADKPTSSRGQAPGKESISGA
jgi:small conductance mechanosensitive channel